MIALYNIRLGILYYAIYVYAEKTVYNVLNTYNIIFDYFVFRVGIRYNNMIIIRVYDAHGK